MSQNPIFTAGESVNIFFCFTQKHFLQCMFKTLRVCMPFELVSHSNLNKYLNANK